MSDSKSDRATPACASGTRASTPTRRAAEMTRGERAHERRFVDEPGMGKAPISIDQNGNMGGAFRF